MADQTLKYMQQTWKPHSKLTRLMILLMLSVLLSCMIVELFVFSIFKFPALGIDSLYHVYPNDLVLGKTTYENIYKPFAKYYDIEDGYKLHSYNNFGLPGIDVDTEKPAIMVFGNSFIEARGTDKTKMATSVLHDRLNASGFHYSVMNMARGGLIPSTAFYRLRFWSKCHTPQIVLMVLQEPMRTLMEQNALQIDPAWNAKNNYKRVSGLPLYIAKICSVSAFMNLLRNGIKYANRQPQTPILGFRKSPESAPIKYDEKKIDKFTDVLYNELSILNAGQYTLLVLSVFDKGINGRVMQICNELGIPFGSLNSAEMSATSLRLRGAGHLNDEGNEFLGEKLFRFAVQFLQKDQPSSRKKTEYLSPTNSSASRKSHAAFAH